MKYCEWCGKSTTNKPVHVAQTPILEWIEERINKLGRKEDERMWEKYYDDDSGDDEGGMFVVVEE